MSATAPARVRPPVAPYRNTALNSLVGKGSWTPWLYLAPALTVLVALLAYPLYQLGLLSLLEYSQAQVSGGEPTRSVGFGQLRGALLRPPVLAAYC